MANNFSRSRKQRKMGWDKKMLQIIVEKKTMMKTGKKQNGYAKFELGNWKKHGDKIKKQVSITI